MNSTTSHTFSFSLTIKIWLLVSCLVAIIWGTALVVVLEVKRDHEATALHTRHEKMVNLLVTSMREPLNDFSPATAVQGLRFMLHEEGVQKIVVYSTVYDMSLVNFEAPDFDENGTEYQVYTLRRHVLLDGEILGFVEVSLNSYAMEKRLQEARRLCLFATGGGLIVCAIGIAIIVWITLMRPARMLAEYAARLKTQANGSSRFVREMAVPELAAPFAGIAESLHSLHLQNVELHKKLALHRTTDEETGLLNRKAFLDSFERESLLSDRYRVGVSLLVCSIDGYAALGSEQSSERQEEAIDAVANLFTQVADETAVLARWAHDSLIMYLPDADAAKVKELAHLLMRQLEEYAAIRLKNSTSGEFSCSIAGLTREDSETHIMTLERLHRALIQARAQGENVFTVYVE